MKMLKEIPGEYIKQFEPSMKVGLLATADVEGQPHITIISSLQANTPKQMIWGQFIEGISKTNVKHNPKTGFLIMNLDKELWRGKALWTHESKEGPEYVMYNNKPLYRYNTYFGIHTVHYMDLCEITEKTKLNTMAIAAGAVMTKFSKNGAKTGGKERILKPWSQKLFDTLGVLKFISYFGEDGFPNIVPILQAQAADSGRIAFSTVPYGRELSEIKSGVQVAIFGLTLEMENVLAVGKFNGFKRVRGIKLGVMDIERVYNSMPPKQGYIYPEEKLEAVTQF
jgi:hypothetical protein